MTYRKSSTKPRISDLKHSFRTGAVIPVVLAALLTLLLNNYNVLEYHAKMAQEEISNGFRYFFFDATYSLYIIKFLLFAFGGLMGVMAFYFVNSKKMSNVFLSFNIKRTDLFINRCIASIVYMFIAVLIPMTISIVINIYFLGFEPIILYPWIYLILALFTHVFMGFAFAVLATICAGSIVESGIYSLIFFFTPLIVFSGIEMFLGAFLHGYPITFNTNWNTRPFYLMEGEFGVYNSLGILNPLKFLEHRSSSFFSFTHNDRLISFSGLNKDETISISFSDYLPVLAWLAISVGLLLFANYVLNKRKAENAGSFGRNIVARNYSIGILSFFSFCLVVSRFNSFSVKSVLLGIVAFVVVYFILELVILRNFSELRAGLIKLPIMLGILLLITIIPVTGGFGYSKKLPDADSIESVNTSYVSDGNLLFHKDDFNIGMGPFISENDIDILLSLHQNFIDEGYMFKGKLAKGDSSSIKTKYYVQYKLKNGKTFNRFYQLEDEQLKQAIAKLGDSEFTRNLMNEYFLMSDQEYYRLMQEAATIDFYFDDISIEQYREQQNLYNLALPFSLDYESSSFILSKKIDGKGEQLSRHLTSDEFHHLKECIYKDYIRLGAEKILFPKSKVLGSIAFNAGVLENSYKQDSMHEDFNTFVDFNYEVRTIQVTEEMSETIAFLQEKDLLRFFDSDLEIVAAGIFKPRNVSEHYVFGGAFWSFEHETKTYSPLYYLDVGHEDEWKQSLKAMGAEFVTDKDKLNALFENSYMTYIIGDEDYGVQFIMSDNTSVVLYLPAEKVNAYLGV